MLTAWAGLLSALVGAGCRSPVTIHELVPTARPAPSPVATSTADASAPVARSYPPTEMRPVTDVYHGIRVADPYRWLEPGDDEAVRAWTAAQNEFSRPLLSALPGREAIGARLTTILTARDAHYESLCYRSGKLFALEDKPPLPQARLVVLDSPDSLDGLRVLLDPNELDPSGKTTIDWYVSSFDGKKAAVSLSRGGTEIGDVHVYDVASGELIDDPVPRVHGGTAGGSLAWSPRGDGFYYTRYPREPERTGDDLNFYVQVYYHALGSPTAQDRYEIGRDFPRIAEIELAMEPRRGRLLATVQRGDGGEFELHLREVSGRWSKLAGFEDDVLQAAFGPRDQLYLLSRAGAPRGKILRLRLPAADLASATTVVPEGEDTIVPSFFDPPTILPTDRRLYVLYQLGGPSEVRLFDLDGKALATPAQLPVGAAHSLTRLEGDEVLFANWSFVEPPAYFRVGVDSATATKTALAPTAPVDMSRVRVVREMATSKDGTQVPVNILLPPDYQPGRAIPCVVNGYGGYGVSLAPRYRPHYAVLLEHGVCYAVANLRGGGEYGEAWHRAGNLTRKQNVFDDFVAVIQHLVEAGYARADAVGIIGGSNGGLLMGATVTQHPELVRAAVSFVGIYDMLRVELSPNGAFNVTEFGSVKDEEQFRALYAYSPYHRVEDGTAYPAMLMITGDNDPRVDPMQSRKMVARLQAATTGEGPILLTTATDAGHGVGASLEQEIADITDAYSFLLAALGTEKE